MTTAKMLGISDEVTTCDCCGKSNLKRTVALEINEAVVHYGCDCAALALVGRKNRKDAEAVHAQATAIQYAKQWLPVRSVESVARAIWNKFGLNLEVRGADIVIWMDGKAVMV